MEQAALQTIKVNPSNLSEEQLQRAEQVRLETRLVKMVTVIQYGLGAQEKMAEFSDRALRNISARDVRPVGDMLGEIITLLKDFEWEEKKGLFGKTKRTELSLKELQEKYKRIENIIDEMKENLLGQRIQLLQDMHILDDLSEMNEAHIGELEILLLAGRQRVEEERQTTLAEKKRKADESEDLRDVQAYQEFEELCDAFERKLLDLNVTRTAALQLGPQIRLLQRSQSAMAAKIDSVITNVIPMWKTRMVVLLGLENLNRAMGSQAMINEYTNEMLTETSGKIRSSAREAAKLSQKSVVDLETLKRTNEDLAGSFSEVMRIQEEGQGRRQEIEQELGMMQSEIKLKLQGI